MRLARLAFLLFICCFVSVAYPYHHVADSLIVCEGAAQTFVGERSRAAGNVLQWQWNFDDPASGEHNTSNQESPQHTFSKPGTYRVHLVMINDRKEQDTVITPVEVFPRPKVEVSNPRICVGTEAVFRTKLDSAGWKDLVWKWEFGDGKEPSFAGPQARHTYRKAGNYEVQVTVSPSSGCSTQVQRKVLAHGVPSPMNLVSDTVCFGDRAELRAGPSDSLRVHWFASAQSSASLHIGSLFFTPPLPEKTTFFVAHKDKKGCLSPKIPVQVSVFSSESTHILTEPTSPLQWSETQVKYRIKGESPIQSVRWAFGDGDSSAFINPMHRYKGPGKYQIQALVRNAQGCQLQLEHAVVILPPPPVFLPAAFSPNQDGINDTFKADSHRLKSCTIVVSNAYGEIIFMDDTPAFEWNGKKLNGTMAPEGIYLYQLKGVDLQDKKFVKEGSVTLVR